MSLYKTLFVHPKNDYTGSTRVLANIISTEYKDEIIPIITLKNDGFLSDLQNVKIINCWLPKYKGKPIRVFSEIIYSIQIFCIVIFQCYKFDRIYINTIIPFSAALSARIMRKNVTYHIHEVFKDDKLLNRIRKFVFDNIKSHRIFVSHYTKSSYKEKLNCTSEIKYNKLTNYFLDKVQFRDYGERNLNKILMVSSLSIEKGVFNYIKLASILPQYKFILILSTDIDNIKKEINFTIPKNLEIFPTQQDIQPFLSKIDLIVNMTIPSLCIETFGMTILEAMPYGIPAIVPYLGGPIELIVDDFNGYIVDTDNIYAVKLAIMKALSKDNYKRLLVNTIKRFETKFK